MKNPTTGRLPRALAACALACAIPAASGLADEARVTPPLVLSGEVGDGFWAYGQINKGVLLYDDGEGADAYALVDNDNSSTRAGLWFRKRSAEDLTFSANVEAQWNPYSTSRVNRLNDGDVDWDTHSLRKAEAIVDLGDMGKVWLGQGAMASDGSAEVDLSGAGLAADSKVADSAGGQRLTFSGGGVSPVSVGQAFKNYDGLGRLLRARYDTASLHGFGLRASTGKNAMSGDSKTQWDIAATFNRSFGDVEVAAAAAFSRPGGDHDRFSGSASALHAPTGLNLTIAAASEERVDARDAEYLYGKVGWRGDLVDWGETAFAADYYSGDHIVEDGSESMSWGVAVVQAAPAIQTDFYLTVRVYQHDGSASYEDGLAVLAGARFRF